MTPEPIAIVPTQRTPVNVGARPRWRAGCQAEALAPATPRPAASLILLRRGGKHRARGLEVLLLRRSTEASFMPGVWVFPGGALDSVDRRVGGDDEEAAHRACA